MSSHVMADTPVFNSLFANRLCTLSCENGARILSSARYISGAAGTLGVAHLTVRQWTTMGIIPTTKRGPKMVSLTKTTCSITWQAIGGRHAAGRTLGIRYPTRTLRKRLDVELSRPDDWTGPDD